MSLEVICGNQVFLQANVFCGALHPRKRACMWSRWCMPQMRSAWAVILPSKPCSFLRKKRRTTSRHVHIGDIYGCRIQTRPAHQPQDKLPDPRHCYPGVIDRTDQRRATERCSSRSLLSDPDRLCACPDHACVEHDHARTRRHSSGRTGPASRRVRRGQFSSSVRTRRGRWQHEQRHAACRLHRWWRGEGWRCCQQRRQRCGQWQRIYEWRS